MSKHSGPSHLWIFLLCAATAALLGFGWGLGDSFAVFGAWLLYVGGFIALVALTLSCFEGRWGQVLWWLALVPIAMAYCLLGAMESSVTLAARRVPSPSGLRSALIRENPYEWRYEPNAPRVVILIKPTLVPFFSLFGQSVFVGDCPVDFKVVWYDDKHVKIGCSLKANKVRERDIESDLHIEYTFNSLDDLRYPDSPASMTSR